MSTATADAVVYLDHNATTPVVPEVADAMPPFLCAHFAHLSRDHVLGHRARQAAVSFPGVLGAEVLVHAPGVAVALPPVDATPVPVNFPKTGHMTEQMAGIAARDLAARIEGRAAEAAELSARYVLDMGDRGVYMAVDPVRPPRDRIPSVSEGRRWVLAKQAFERAYLFHAQTDAELGGHVLVRQLPGEQAQHVCRSRGECPGGPAVPSRHRLTRRPETALSSTKTPSATARTASISSFPDAVLRR